MSEQINLTIEAKVLGSRRPFAERWAIELKRDTTSEPLTLRDALVAIVTDEARAFNERQRERRLTRIMSREAIAQAAETGKVDLGGQTDHAPQEVTVDEAVANALQAFADRFYLVLLDGAPVETLDSPLTLTTASRMTFVRLVPLIGG